MRTKGVTLAVKLCKLIFALFYLQKKFQSSNSVYLFQIHISNAKQDEIPEFKILQCASFSSQFSTSMHQRQQIYVIILRMKYRTFERSPLNRFRCTQRTRTIVLLVFRTVRSNDFSCMLFDFDWLNVFFLDIFLFVFCQRVPFGLAKS